MAFPVVGLLNDRIALRFLIVASLGIGLLIPLLLVSGVADDRRSYYLGVVANIAQSYGFQQSVAGPFLIIPTTDKQVAATANGVHQEQLVESHHILLPATLNMHVRLNHEFRSRAIYRVPVYQAEVLFDGSLSIADPQAIAAQHETVHWDQAYIAFGIADTRAITRSSSFRLGARELALGASTGVDWLPNGIRIDLDGIDLRDAAEPFALTLTLAGTGRFAMLPIGNQSEFTVHSSWPHPKFAGRFLPAEHVIDGNGFQARWAVSALARGTAQSFPASPQRFDFLRNEAAIELHEPVTQYTTIDRGVKYGALFIALTYLAVLCFELVTGARLHLVQYGVVGLALVLFYLVLLSLSEHLRFTLAYLAATLTIVLLLGWYGYSITSRARLGVIFALFQGGLYWVLFVLLRLEDYALLTGTSVLLSGLAALMFVTRGLHREPVRRPEDRTANASDAKVGEAL